MEQNQNNGPKNDGPKNKQSLLVILLCIMVSLVMFNVLGRMTRGVSSEVPYSQFIEMLEKGEVDLEGKVDSLTYLSKNTDNRDESLFRRMFR